MNIGWISASLPYLPSRTGFKLSGGNLIPQLSRRHRIDLVSLLRDDDEQHLEWARQNCSSVETIPVKRVSLLKRFASFLSGCLRGQYLNPRAPLQAIVRSRLESRQWDVLHVEGGFVAGLLPPDLPIPSVLSVHDAEVLRAREMLNCKLNLRYRLRYTVRKYYEPRYERLVYPRFGRCVVVAERDLIFNQELVRKAQFACIPYGVDVDYFHPMPVKKEDSALVFHGHLGYPPNIKAALDFTNDVFPLIRREHANATFHLVGANPAPEIQALASRPGIRISPNLPDLRSEVCLARVYVCAVRHGLGIKNKVLEAMAMRLPLVCYPGSVAGLDCISGKHLLVAQNPQEFTTHVLDLLRDPERAERIAQAGREFVQQKYSWEIRALEYEGLFQQVIEERRTRANHNGR